jgi:hypothetical protein
MLPAPIELVKLQLHGNPNVSQCRRWINMSGRSGRAFSASTSLRGEANRDQPGCVRCQRRSRSQTRSSARRHACEQNRCSGLRRCRTNSS